MEKKEREKVEMFFINTITQKISLTIFALLLFSPLSFVYAQTEEVKPKIVVAPVKQKFKRKYKKVMGGSETSAEKSIAVEANVNISLCVSEGNLKINGWERNEIRAFVNNGSETGFKVLQKNKQSSNAVWVMVVGYDTAKNKELNSDECLSGEEIELDVPRGASVNVKSRTSEAKIESVGRARIENVGGDIFLINVAQGIDATTYEGDVRVEKSGGAMTLTSTTGNIVAFEVAPSQIGDIFKAKTSSGAITLQSVEHRQMEIGSNSGSMKFVGEFLSGGQYRFGTSNGSILLAIPQNSSCKINASFGFGAFNSELPLQNVKKNPNPTSKAQSLSALIGNGDANVSLTTYSGAIRIKKSEGAK